MKQGEEDAYLMKKKERDTGNYILQENTKTKTAIIVVISFLVLLIAGIVLSAWYFQS